MNLVILGGNSPRHHAWVREVAANVGPLFDKVLVWDYQHWQTGEPFCKINLELSKLNETVDSFEPYIIIGKSIGTILASQGVNRGILKPKGLLFFGTPIKSTNPGARPLGKWLSSIDQSKIIFVQNQNDPFGSYQMLQSRLKDEMIDDATTIMWPGQTHDYVDYDKMVELSSRFTK